MNINIISVIFLFIAVASFVTAILKLGEIYKKIKFSCMQYMLFVVLLSFAAYRGLYANFTAYLITHLLLLVTFALICMFRYRAIHPKMKKKRAVTWQDIQYTHENIKLKLRRLTVGRYEDIAQAAEELGETVETSDELDFDAAALEKISSAMKSLDDFVNLAVNKPTTDITVFNNKAMRICRIIRQG
ncbi:MAG: hypothetical protein LBR54_00175 [Oscillospiraceae bacterium]|jgi:hypothetical protein|nr:hypothetical protein [Oscillospiraceae bacterium]